MLEVMASHASLWFCALAHSIPIHRASCRPYHRRHRGWAVGQGHLLQALSHPPRWHDEDHGRRHGHHPAANGAMTKNLNKGIGKIKYDNFGHMEEIIFDNSNSTSYVYAADGTKLRVSHKKVLPGNVIAGGLFHQISTNTTDYWGDVLYEKDKSLTVLFDGGYVVIDKDSTLSWHYYEKDHLGSNRIVMDDQGNMEQVNHYYPFGNSFGECNNSDKGSEVQRYKFNGKEQELVHNLNLYDYGARMYDSQLGSWTSVDPLAENHYESSPYMFCGGDPINRVDYFGLDYWYTNDSIQIQQFMNSYNSGMVADMTGWSKSTDSEFCASMYYNDKTNTAWYTHGGEENGEFVLTSRKMENVSGSIWGTAVGNGGNAVGGVATAFQKEHANSRISSNGHFYMGMDGKRPFYGNQYVSTYSMKTIGNRVSRGLGFISFGSGIYDFYQGVQADGNTVGYNAIRAVVTDVGGYVGSNYGTLAGIWLGTKCGASFGCCTPPWGPIIGGAIGGIAGGIGANWLIDECYLNW